MNLTVAPKSSRSSRSHASHHPHSRQRPGRAADRGTQQAACGVLGRYTDPAGRTREVVARSGPAGSVLVVDRDASTLGDRRLVAHLAADEPSDNAELVCRHYLQDPDGRWCRRVAAADLQTAPFTESDRAESESDALVDRGGHRYRLEPLASDLSIPEVRWRRDPPRTATAEPEPVSLREVVACLESYRPARDLTVAALARHRNDPSVSMAVLRAELRRLDASRIVLNRGLRQAVLAAVQSRGLSMSEIAIRCGRVKYDSRGNASGETSWLSRRVGISPEGGARVPTPWIHSEVLALIARSGLGVSPREVELG